MKAVLVSRVAAITVLVRRVESRSYRESERRLRAVRL